MDNAHLEIQILDCLYAIDVSNLIPMQMKQVGKIRKLRMGNERSLSLALGTSVGTQGHAEAKHLPTTYPTYIQNLLSVKLTRT